MRKIRIGKDIKIRWGVTIDGEVADPAVYDLTLELRDAFGSAVEIAQPTLVDGLLETTFFGKDHKRTGAYRLTLWLNKGKEGQSVVDACDAFTLVSCSCDEGGDSDLDLEVVDVATASLDVGGSSGGGSGVSDYSLLSNKPSINKVVLNGNKTAEELGLQPKGDYALRKDIPSVQGLATEKYVDEAIKGINFDVSIVEQTDTVVTILPNVLNVWGEVAELNITLAEGAEGVVNEYMVQFTSGATATTLTLPDGIVWMSAPNIQANKTYQLSIINNLGVIGEFGNE